MTIIQASRPARFLPALALLLLSLPGFAASPVWKIEKDGREFYLGGTMHVLTARDYPLPGAFATAYDNSARVVFETDIAAMNDPAFQQYLLRAVSYGDGGSLRQAISATTWQALAGYFEARGVPMSSVEHFKPGMVATMMTVIELQRLGVNSEGVDAYYDQLARADGKARGKLETLEQQASFLANLGAGREDALLRYSLADLERLPVLWREMTRAWRSGDIRWLNDNLAQDMRRNFPGIYRSLLVDRNHDWMPQLEAMAATPEVEFVLVGALHLVGEAGLLALLEARAYRVTQLP